MKYTTLQKLKAIGFDGIGLYNERLLLFALQALCSMNESADSDPGPATQGAY